MSQEFVSLREMIDELKQQVERLEKSRDDLQLRIVQMVCLNENYDTPITPREIAQLLFDWANDDNDDK